MPTIEDYEPLAPFTLDELVAAANSLLRDLPSMVVQPRTIRYYIAQGLLDPPRGSPKFARYGVEQLRNVVSIRRWVHAGESLEECAKRLGRTQHSSHPPSAPMTAAIPMSAKVQEEPRPFAHDEVTVRRIRLSQFSTLELAVDADAEAEMKRAIRWLERRQKK